MMQLKIFQKLWNSSKTRIIPSKHRINKSSNSRQENCCKFFIVELYAAFWLHFVNIFVSICQQFERNRLPWARKCDKNWPNELDLWQISKWFTRERRTCSSYQTRYRFGRNGCEKIQSTSSSRARYSVRFISYLGWVPGK